MGHMVIRYDTLSLSQQVLERQAGHAHRIAVYLPAQADIGDSTAREEELLSRIEGIVAETRRDAERIGRQDAEREAERADAARRGQLGPDWQSVQGRIDAGQTTLVAVFGGADHAPAAVRLRQRVSGERV